MKKYIFALTIMFTLTVSLSQAQIRFQKFYGDTNSTYANSIKQTLDGGYIIAGTKTNQTNDVFLVKTNPNGDTLWSKTYGDTRGHSTKAVQQTTDGGYIIAGSTNIPVNYGSGFLIKTDSNGDILWKKIYGGTTDDYVNDVQQTSDGGYILGGFTLSYGAGNYDFYLIKTDAVGNILWTKTFGGNGQDFGNSVKETIDGGFIIIGSTTSFLTTKVHIYLVKTDLSGNMLWSKILGGSVDHLGNCVQETTDGGFVITGFSGTGGAVDVDLIKTDSIGNILWSKAFGGTGNDQGNFVQQTADDGFIITGFTSSFGIGNSDYYFIKTSNNGNLLWSKTFGGMDSEVANACHTTTDGGFIIAGGLTDTTYFTKAYIIKTDSVGNSGCNESNPNTTETTSAIVASTPPTQISSGGFILNQTMQTSSGCIITSLCLTVGKTENQVKDSFVKFFPNPFSKQTTLQCDFFLTNATLTVYNCFGQRLKQINNLSGHTIVLERNTLPSGLYFLQLTQGNKTITMDKLVITD